VSLDPSEERDRVRREYPFFPRKDLVSLLLVLAAFIALDRVLFGGEAPWWVFLIGPAGMALWEVSKFRMRRHADRFADKHS
jgi:hypothetical protein